MTQVWFMGFACALALGTAACSSQSTMAPHTATLAGDVYDTSGVLAPGIAVAAQMLRVKGGVIGLNHTTTDAHGHFDFGPVVIADWLVSAGDEFRAAADTVVLPASGVALRLVQASQLRGRVLEGPPGGPYTPASVEVLTDNQAAFAFTGPLGYFQIGGQPPGGWWLYVVDSTFGRDTTVRVTIAAPGDTVVVPDIVLPGIAGVPRRSATSVSAARTSVPVR